MANFDLTGKVALVKIFPFSSVITAQYTGGECERGKQRRTGMP